MYESIHSYLVGPVHTIIMYEATSQLYAKLQYISNYIRVVRTFPCDDDDYINLMDTSSQLPHFHRPGQCARISYDRV